MGKGRPRAYALTEKAYRYLDLFGAGEMPPRARVRLRPEVPHTAPGVPLPKGLCPVCGNTATVVGGRMGLHSRGPHDSGWCRGYGQPPMRMVTP